MKQCIPRKTQSHAEAKQLFSNNTSKVHQTQTCWKAVLEKCQCLQGEKAGKTATLGLFLIKKIGCHDLIVF